MLHTKHCWISLLMYAKRILWIRNYSSVQVRKEI